MVALLFSASMTRSPTWMPSPLPTVENSPPLLVITVPLLTVRVPMVSCAKAGKARAAVAASTTLASVFMGFVLELGGYKVAGPPSGRRSRRPSRLGCRTRRDGDVVDPQVAADLLGRAADRGIDQFQPLPRALFGRNLEVGGHPTPFEAALQRAEPGHGAPLVAADRPVQALVAAQELGARLQGQAVAARAQQQGLAQV